MPPPVAGGRIGRDELWPILFGLACATLAQLSLLWDISWHMSIGRDTFATPPHLGLYLGGGLPGVGFGALVLHTSFFGSPSVRDRSVRVWGLRGPLGVWVAIWGSVAMLVAAPFDAWWHVNYGVDLKAASPPHVVLLLGLAATHLGAGLLAAAAINRSVGGGTGLLGSLLSYSMGIMLLVSALFGIDTGGPAHMHSPIFYVSAAAAFPVWLVGATTARSRWPATSAALWYTGLRLLMTWVLPLFAATPRLEPVYVSITHMVPPGLPFLLVVPAIAFDLMNRRSTGRDAWCSALALGPVFVVMLAVVQWPFAELLMRPVARGWLLAADNFPYNLPQATYTAQHWFIPWSGRLVPAWLAFLAAVPVAVCSAQVGLWLRAYLRRIQR